ncbi:unnamed protein product, partial [Rotaria sp. Silwood2]
NSKCFKKSLSRIDKIFKFVFFSRCLIHNKACNCGSIQKGKRFVCKVRIPFCIEKLTNVLNDFRKRFDTAMEDKLKFQDETDIAIRRRIAAEKLLIGFKSEIIRWKNELYEMKQYENELIGNCLLASAFLAYCSPFSYEIRQELLKYPVLFKDVDEYIDPIILDILSKNIQGGLTHQYVKLGDKYIDIDKIFRMYLTCRLSNPILSTLHFSYSKVINYTVTLKGLEEQLLSSLVKIERRELEEMRETLIQEIFENQQQQKLLEDSLLRELTTSTGNILDNTELIETLENTKIKVSEVMQALNLGERTRQDIEKLRDTYRLAARRGAVLYFTLVQMSIINSMVR